MLSVTGIDGAVVSSNSLQVDAAGEYSIEWNGKSYEDRLLRPGVWAVNLTATDAGGRSSIPYTIYIKIFF